MTDCDKPSLLEFGKNEILLNWMFSVSMKT